jgi:hypothetical protein
MKQFRVTLTLAAILFAFSSAVFAQQRPDTSSAALRKAIAEYARQTEAAPVEEGFATKAVSRTDKAESVVIGAVALVGGTDFLDDGTPFRIVAVRSQRPVSQNVFVVCIGSSLNNSCGRLTNGKRASFTSDVIVIEEGDEAGLALLFVKKLQT